MSKQTTYKNIAGFRCLRNITKQTNDLYLVHCGQQQCPPGYTYDHKTPNEYHLHFVLNGKGILIINNKTYHIKKNDIFLIPKGYPVQYFADDKEPWEYVWVTFDGNMSENYLNHVHLDADNPVITSTIAVTIYIPFIYSILDTNKLTYANEIRRVGYLYEILSTLIEAQNAQSEQYDYSSETYVDYALQYIKTNYRDIKVNDIANYIGINRSYLTAIFKKKLDVSPQKYLVSYRLQKAAKLLKSTDMSITEIASEVGYVDSISFSKMFKQEYNMSPKTFREA
jgi:YesN/AraC family two-component response regulator